MPAAIVLDTTAFSVLIYADPQIVARYGTEIRKGTRFLLCSVVWYETRRGLQKIGAARKLERLTEISHYFIWDDFDQADWLLAANTWAALTAEGRRPGDADLLIAVFAAQRNASVITSNVRHFSVLSAHLALSVENWIE